MGFKKNDRVRINASGHHSQHGQLGTVDHTYSDGTTFTVRLDNGNYHSFFLEELDPVDKASESLIELAETLDKARLQANAIEETAPQGGVYGRIATALNDTLGAYFTAKGSHYTRGLRAYQALLDGCTVREAIAEAEK